MIKIILKTYSSLHKSIIAINNFITSKLSINILSILSTLSVFSILTLFNTPIIHAKIYQWTDSGGQLHYSDIPPKDLEKINIIDLNNSTSDSAKSEKINQSKTNYDKKIEKKLKDYKEVKQHHNDEDIGPMLQKLKSQLKSRFDSKQDNKKIQKEQNKQKIETQKKEQQVKLNNQNCEIAKNNLESLEISTIILSKKNKLNKLSKSEHKHKIAEAELQIEKYC